MYDIDIWFLTIFIHNGSENFTYNYFMHIFKATKQAQS